MQQSSSWSNNSISTKPYTNMPYSQAKNQLSFEGHRFKGQGHRNIFKKLVWVCYRWFENFWQNEFKIQRSRSWPDLIHSEKWKHPGWHNIKLYRVISVFLSCVLLNISHSTVDHRVKIHRQMDTIMSNKQKNNIDNTYSCVLLSYTITRSHSQVKLWDS